MADTRELWTPPGFEKRGGISEFRKAKPPKLGPSFGAHGPDAGVDKYKTLPGGSVLQFDLSRLTLSDYRQMQDHYQISASHSVLKFTMHQLDWWIECEDPKIAEAVETNLRQVWTRLIRAISQAYWAGYSPIALEFENDFHTGRIKINKFKDLIPEECSVNYKEVTGARPIGAGGLGVASKHHIFDGIKQYGRQGHIPVDHSLWYPLLMQNGDMRGTKLLRPAFPSYFFSQLIHLFANRYFERFGEPMIVARAPFDDEVDMPNGTKVSGREATMAMLEDLRNRSAVVLPNDRSGNGNGDKDDFEYTLDFLESQLRGVDFQRYLRQLDEEMALALFVPVLLFRTADVGSYNLGQAHERTFAYQVNGLAGDLAEYLDRFVLSKLVDYNFSPRAPRARFVFRRMGKDRDETIRAVVQASIQQEQMRPDIDELGLAMGMKLHEIRQVADPATGDLRPADAPSTEGTNLGETNEDETGENAGNPLANSPNTNLSVNAAKGRLLGQLIKAEREGTLAEFNVNIGHRNQAWNSMMEDGYPSDVAESRVRRAWGNASHWLNEAKTMDIHPEKLADVTVQIIRDELASAR